MQDHERPMLGTQVAERAIQRVPVVEGAIVVAGGSRIDRLRRHLDDPALPAAGFVDGRVHQQPMKPAVEPIRIAKARKVAPGANECLLHRVTGELVIAEDQASRGIHSRRRRPGKLGKGVAIALSRLIHQRPLVHGPPPSVARRLAALTEYGDEMARFVAVGAEIARFACQRV